MFISYLSHALTCQYIHLVTHTFSSEPSLFPCKVMNVDVRQYSRDFKKIARSILPQFIPAYARFNMLKNKFRDTQEVSPHGLTHIKILQVCCWWWCGGGGDNGGGDLLCCLDMNMFHLVHG